MGPIKKQKSDMFEVLRHVLRLQRYLRLLWIEYGNFLNIYLNLFIHYLIYSLKKEF